MRLDTRLLVRRVLRLSRFFVLGLAGLYVLVLLFPQPLFANQISYKNFQIYSNQPIDQRIYPVLDRAAARLATSPINSSDLTPSIVLTNGFGTYAALSLYVGANSFGKGYGALPGSNVFINKIDTAGDLVFRNAAAFNARSLSGVIAHETMHLLVRKHFGYWRNLTFPAWKKEGYAEYVAGGTTLPYDVGIKMWKATPDDAAGYRYFKYYMLVKYLLEQKKVSVDELFNGTFDPEALSREILRGL